MTDNEMQAIALAGNPKRLHKRLLDAKAVLAAPMALKFKNATFNYAKMQLEGDGYILQWRVRRKPSEPESYNNQQTNRGDVVLTLGP
jgi:hypothetical protein